MIIILNYYHDLGEPKYKIFVFNNRNTKCGDKGCLELASALGELNNLKILSMDLRYKNMKIGKY